MLGDFNVPDNGDDKRFISFVFSLLLVRPVQDVFHRKPSQRAADHRDHNNESVFGYQVKQEVAETCTSRKFRVAISYLTTRGRQSASYCQPRLQTFTVKSTAVFVYLGSIVESSGLNNINTDTPGELKHPQNPK